MRKIEINGLFHGVGFTKTMVCKECPGSRSFCCSQLGLLNCSYVRVIKEEGLSRRGLVLVGRWARAVG